LVRASDVPYTMSNTVALIWGWPAKTRWIIAGQGLYRLDMHRGFAA
jgi:hypothetical protein